MSRVAYKIGDRIRFTDPAIINELRSEHKVLRLLKKTGEEQPFTYGREGRNAGQSIPSEPREDSEYIVETIEGSVIEINWCAHPTGDMVWERDKFQSLEVMLDIGAYSSPKEYWVEKIEDGKTEKPIGRNVN